MLVNKLSESLTLSFVVSCLIAPFVILVILFYYLFRGVSKTFLFGAVEIVTRGTSGFTFNFKPQLLLVIIGVFVITFLVSFFFKTKVVKNKE